MVVPKMMNALVARAPGDYRLEEIAVPVPGEDEVLLKVEACGICAGDLKTYHGAPKFWGNEHMPRYVGPPFVPGHEFVGHVAAVGSRKTGEYKLGDRLIAEAIVPCGRCRLCRNGDYWMCQPHDIFGFKSNVNGGMAEYILLPQKSIIHRVPEEMPLEYAALIEPFSCSMYCINKAHINYNDVVVLSGAGTLGLGMVSAIRECNPKVLVVLDLNDKRLKLAKQFGADITVNVGREDARTIVDELTDSYGCDVYIEAAGHPSSVVQGLDLIRKLGHFVEFSVFSEPVTVDWSIISDNKELTVTGVHCSPYCYAPTIEWLSSGRFMAEGVVSHIFGLEQWKAAYETAWDQKNALKVLLKP